MALKLVKQPTFIQAPRNSADVTSGIQTAASGSVIGKTTTVALVAFPGQDIGKATGATYFLSA
jgi:hypothetical protein